MERTCILVLGMHRSGTSALTRTLSIMGADLPQRLLAGGIGNSEGHWEPHRLMEYHDRLLQQLGSAWYDWRPLDLTSLSTAQRNEIRADWRQIVSDDFGNSDLFVLKEPRICRFAPFFIQALQESNLKVVPVLLVRNPLEVVSSLLARSENWPDSYTETDAALLWLSHVLESEYATREMTRALVTYDSLLGDWQDTIARVQQNTGIAFPEKAQEVAPLVAAFLNPKLRHFERRTNELALNRELGGWINDAYEALLMLQSTPNSQRARERLDAIRREWNRAEPVLQRFASDFREASDLRGKQVAELDRLRKRRKRSSAQIKRLENELAEARKSEAVQEADVERLRTERDTLAVEAEGLRASKGLAEHRIADLEKQLAEQSDQLGGFRASLGVADRDNRDAKQIVEAFRETILTADNHKLGEERYAYELQLSDLRYEIATKQSELARLTQQFALEKSAFDARLSSMEDVIAAQKSGLEDVNRQFRLERQAYDTRISKIRHELAEKQSEFARATTRHQETVRELRSSTSWKLTAPLRSVRSAQRASLEALLAAPSTIRSAGGVGRALAKGLRVLSSEGIGGVLTRLKRDRH